MFELPDKFKQNPFLVWGFFVATIAVFVYLFGREEIMDMIRWIIGMPEEVVVIEGSEK